MRIQGATSTVHKTHKRRTGEGRTLHARHVGRLWTSATYTQRTSGMADAPGVHFGGHDEHEPAHEAVNHQEDGEERLIAAKITQVACLTVILHYR